MVEHAKVTPASPAAAPENPLAADLSSAKDLRAIGKSFLANISNLAKTKFDQFAARVGSLVDRADDAVTKAVGNVAGLATGYVVTRVQDTSLISQDYNRIKDSVVGVATKTWQGFSSFVKDSLATIKGAVKQRFSEMRSKNLEKTQNKALGKILADVEKIKDPEMKKFVQSRIKEAKDLATTYCKKELAAYKERPLNQKGASPVGDLISINRSVDKGLQALTASALHIDRVQDMETRGLLKVEYLQGFNSSLDAVAGSYQKLENPTAKELAEHTRSAYLALKLISKATEASVELVQKAVTQGAENAQAVGVDYLARFNANMQENLKDGHLSVAEYRDLDKKLRPILTESRKAAKDAVGSELKVKAAASELGKLSPAELRALIEQVQNGVPA